MTNQTGFLESLGWAVLSSLWQLALLWLIYQLFTALFPRIGAAAKSRLAASLLFIGFAWFLLTFILSITQHSPSAGILISSPAAASVNQWLNKILPVASFIYLLLLLIPLLRFIRNYRYVQVIRQYGLSRPAPEWRLFVNTIAARMGIKKPVHIWISEWVSSPVTIGYLKPVILVPLAAINQLSTPQMEAVLLHELAHIRRYDYLLNLLINFIRTLLYFNPFARAFVQIVESEREKSCDQLVMQFQYQGHEYASALLSLEKLSRSQQLLVLGAAGQGKELLHRIETILGVQQKQPFSLRKFTTLLTALFYIISLNIVFVISRSFVQKGQTHQETLASASMNDLSETAGIYSREPVSEMSPADHLSLLPAVDQVAHPSGIPALASLAAQPALMNVSYQPEIEDIGEVELDPEEETMIREAVASSRKIMESTQWKSMEKNLADVFNEKEKEALKLALRNEMNKFDWSKWENKLRLAYDQVNWDQVNNQLNQAIALMKKDSLVKVYNEAMISLSKAREELASLASEKSNSEADQTLKALADKQRQLEKELNRLKATKQKKVVCL